MADWKDTLNLPRTDFPMRGNLPTSEPENGSTIAVDDSANASPRPIAMISIQRLRPGAPSRVVSA